MRKLARIETIDEISPIPEADKIEVARIQGWDVVVKKGDFKPGNKCVYFEIDSFLPIKPEYEFLRAGCYRKLDDKEGFRIKTIKLKGQVSQGLALPLETLNGLTDKPAIQLEPGTEVTELLGVTKYERPIPAQLAGKTKGGLPFNVPKTDEERVQNLAKELSEWSGHFGYVTEKLNGSSMSVYLFNDEFGICSRNLNLIEDEKNTFWKVAREMDLETKLRALGKNITIQGELIGEGVQKNTYKLKGQTFRMFNAFNPDIFKHYNYRELLELSTQINVPIVPVLNELFEITSIEDILKVADGKSVLNSEVDREGIVIRTRNRRRISFKAISNEFLLKGEE